MTARSVTITHYDKPWTANSSRRESHWVDQRRIKAWRQAFATLARHEPAFTRPVVVVVDHQTRTRAKVDTAACCLTAKAALDGLVDAGLLPDDGPEHVTSVTFLPAHRTGRDGLSLTLTEVE